MAHPVAMLSHELPLYTFNTSFVVSYHCIPSVGELGADALTVAHGIVFDISLLASMFIHAPAVYVGAVGIGHPSFIALPVAPSNTARCQSVLEAGHDTSHVPAP